MTELQKLILDALDQLGAMNEHELRTACLIEPNQRGGFRTTLNGLFKRYLVGGIGKSGIRILPEGVHAIEAYNIAHPDHCSSVPRPKRQT